MRADVGVYFKPRLLEKNTLVFSRANKLSN